MRDAPSKHADTQSREEARSRPEDARLFDLRRAGESDSYCDEVRGTLADAVVALSELSTHLQGQLVAVHPAYDMAVDGFGDPSVRDNPAARQARAVEQLQGWGNPGLTDRP